eukprot:Trichotokara_eunicae@DN5288_c0_g1_i4.p1
MNVGLDESKKRGLELSYAYEEALGYGVVPNVVPDKDGVSAFAMFLEMSAIHKKETGGIFGYLKSLKEKYGYFVSNNFYLTCHDQVLIKKTFDSFRSDYLWSVGPHKVSRIRDVTVGYDSGASDKVSKFRKSPESQMVQLFFESGATITIRTSGTEPKVKIYSELGGSDAAAAKEELQNVVDELKRSSLLSPFAA